ncbi:MAG: X2-like carbohydrate binding domain-containing protein, partial [Halanaerobiaceae bacterium]
MKNIKCFLLILLIIPTLLTLTACDQQIEEITYTLTIGQEGEGKTTPAEGQHKSIKDNLVDLKAEPAEGWNFVKWKGEVQEANNKKTKTLMDKDKTVTAVFEPIGNGADINPTTPIFDKNDPEQQDISSTISWNSATEIVSIKIDEEELLHNEDYLIEENTLIIKKEYLLEQEIGDIELTIEYNEGTSTTLTIEIIESETETPYITPDEVEYDKHELYHEDVVTTITWNQADEITSIVYDESELETDIDYTVNNEELVIKKEYLQQQSTDECELTIDFDNGSPFKLTIDVKETN